jgi:hypothetical protein
VWQTTKLRNVDTVKLLLFILHDIVKCRNDYGRGFRLANRFIGYSQVVTTINYNTSKITVIITHKQNLLYLLALVVARWQISIMAKPWQYFHYPFPVNGFYTGNIKASLNRTLPIFLHYSTHKAFQSHVKSSQADFLYSSVLNVTACLRASAAATNSSSLMLQLLNSAHICIRSTDTHNRKHKSRDAYPANPLDRWLLPTENTRHVTATYCCVDVIAPARKCVYRAVA